MAQPFTDMDRERSYQKRARKQLEYLKRAPRGPGKALAIRSLKGERLQSLEMIIAYGYLCSGENDIDCESVCPFHRVCPYHIHYSRLNRGTSLKNIDDQGAG